MNRKIKNKNSAWRAILLSLFIGILLVSALSSIQVAHAAYPTILVGNYPYGVAFASNGDLYVANYGDNTVSVIDTSTNTVVGSPITVGSLPVAVAYASSNGDIYVVNEGDSSVSVIDTSYNTVTTTIPVGYEPYGVAFSPNGDGDIYVASYGDDTVSVIDTSTNTVVGSPITVGSSPTGVAFASSNGDIYVANYNAGTVSVISTSTNTVVGSPISVGSYPYGVAYASSNGDVYVVNVGDDTVSVLPTLSTGAPSVSVSPSAWTMDAGQSQTFTASASGGSGSYTSYQWYVNGVSQFGETASTFSFAPAASGSYSITATVTDSTGATSTQSFAATVTVNSALVAPTVTPTPATVNQGQTSALTSTTVSTGTGPYTYQWFEMAPGGSYVDVGSNSPSFNFVTSGSTVTGVWHFELQVTDNVGAVVTSSAATVTVSSTSTATISLNPTSGSQGSTVLVTGSNFEPNAVIHISVAGIGEVSSTTAASDGSFAVNFVIPNGISLGDAAVTASDGINSAQATLTVLQPGEAQTTATVSGNSVTVDQTQTGVSVTVSGPSLSDGSQVTVTTQDYGMSPPGGLTGALGVGTTFFDVQVLKTGGGTFGSDVFVTVSLTDPSFTSDMQILYWNGAGWSVASDEHFDLATYTITGTIPASALSGTPVAVTHGNNFALPEYPLAALIALTTCFAALTIYKRQSNRPKE